LTGPTGVPLKVMLMETDIARMLADLNGKKCSELLWQIQARARKEIILLYQKCKNKTNQQNIISSSNHQI
jgi:hypothetical protein